MLKINKKLSKKGFSLIELMVAVAILAFVVFGIFQAYSTGFMGMVDARDRTVATNYAREAMEDVKNMDFEKIATTTKSVITSNRKYRIDVNVSSESDNLKRVYTVVSWKNRNEIGKTVETTMFVNHTEIFASAAAKIVLYADSYSILNTSTISGATSTKLTAVIKDIKGNTIIDWGARTGEEGDITFTITGRPELGYLNEIIDATSGTTTISITPTEGRASTFFFSNGFDLGETQIGYSEITASVNLPIIGNVSDLVTIKITDGPVKIIFSEPIPGIIKASTGNYSTITVSLCDAENTPLPKSDLGTDVEIAFEVFGEGTLSSYTIIMYDTDEGLASEEIILYSTGIPGLTSVLATADDLESDTADVRFLGPPVSISISADPNTMYTDDDYSTIYVSLVDENGFNTNPDDTLRIFLTLETNAGGYLQHPWLEFYFSESEGIINDTTFYDPSSVGTAIITASDGESMENSVTISVMLALVPDHIELSADPPNVVAGGSSTITATVYDGSKKVTNYFGTITFATDRGSFSGSNTVDVDNGVATIVLDSIEADPGKAIITITDPDPLVLPFNPSTGLVVGFYSLPDHIKLTASPQNVVAGDSSIITATVCDSNSIHISEYIGTITFTIVFGGLSYDISVDTINGMASTVLSFDDAGTAAVTASSWYEAGGYELTPDEIEVDFYVETDLILVEESAYYDSADLIVGFEVDVVGGVDIEVDEMKIIWTESGPQERLSEILIGGVEVYTGSVKSGTIVDIFDVVNSLDVVSLSNEGYTEIELTFIQDMTGRQIDVMFYPPEGWYLIRFDVPEAL